jgi:glycosyltransferase involved in cell wall biosynthesis
MAEWVIVTGDVTRVGGQDKANHALADFLATRGDRVNVVAHRVDEPLASAPNVTVHRVPRPLGSHYLGQRALARTGVRVAREACAREDRTRVVVNGANCPVFDVSWVHMVHAATEPFEERPLSRAREAIVRWGALRAERVILPRSRVLIANSQRTRRDLVERLGVDPARIRLVYLGCESAPEPTAAERAAARRSFEVPEGVAVVSFVGALTRLKGFDTLLDAWARLAKKGTRAILLAAGSGRLSEWQRRLETLRIRDSVHLLGPIMRVPDLLAASDLVVGASRYDAYGLAVQEALARGVPAITTSEAGVSERYPGSLGWLVLDDPEDTDALAEKIARALESGSDLRGEVARFGAELRARTWRDMARDLVEAVESAARVASS